MFEEEIIAKFKPEDDDEYILDKTFKNIVKSQLYKIVAWLNMMPYMDMVRWALDHVDLKTD